MSFIAKLFINGEERNLINSTQFFQQLADVNGRPEGIVDGLPLQLTVESTRNDSFFYEKMFSPTAKIEGKIVYYNRDGMSTMFEVEFVGGNLLGLSEHFSATGNQPMYMQLVISYAAIKYRNIVYLQKWQKTDPFLKGAAPTVIDNEEPEVIDCYYTDLEGNEQAEPIVGEEVYLVLQTENAAGKTIDIDLSNHTKDFIYNDKVIENDIIKDFSVTSDLQKIKLRVIAQEEGEIEKIQK